MTKLQLKKLVAEHQIQAEITGKGSNWEIELKNEAEHEHFQKHIGPSIGNFHGFKTGYGSWILKPGSQSETSKLVSMNID